ncbi:MAG: aminoacyl-tRNA hydrolase [Coxiella sp. RIFCSPHIGHO2_12_FULL_42_15]|nr:MAG: aminoacyl-tRNA hydrolase [Coxiella sp. RIFCSPHIGHO2_12_FULL_42_15]
MAEIKLIVGLGNPGPEYSETRHNVGAWLVEKIATEYNATLRFENKFHGLIAIAHINGAKCILLEPTTYMNESGLAVITTAQFYKITPEEVLVAHDELDFPAGQIRLKTNGGHGGHNGLRDITRHLHTDQFLRLRIGIGHPGHKDKVTPYVLGKPSNADFKLIQQGIDDSIALLPDIVAGEINKVMQRLH